MKALHAIAMTFALAPLQIAANAEAEPTLPVPPRPAPEMAELDYFVGTWHCVSTDRASAAGPEYQVERVITAAKELDGFWLAMHLDEKRTRQNPYPWNVEALLTYDSNTNAFAYIFRDNYGMWSTGTSPGWERDKLVIVGNYMVNGKNLPYRDVYTRHGHNS